MCVLHGSLAACSDCPQALAEQTGLTEDLSYVFICGARGSVGSIEIMRIDLEFKMILTVRCFPVFSYIQLLECFFMLL